MALSPTIPTSFVPKQPVRTTARPPRSGGNIFLVIGMFLIGVAIIGSGIVFAYERYLISARDAKAAEVTAAEQNINPDAVEDFIRTRDRFTAATGLLNTHVAASQFFDALEALTLQSVRFDSLSFMLANDRSAQIQVQGVARTFNALAAQSSAFAGEERIKSAIFSGITVNQNGTVSFALDADLDPRLLILDPAMAPALPAVITPPAVIEEEGAAVPIEIPATEAQAAPAEDPTAPISL